MAQSNSLQNCKVVGSNPTRSSKLCPHRLRLARSTPFQGVGPGSTPGGDASYALVSLVVKVLPCKQGSVVRFHSGAPSFVSVDVEKVQSARLYERTVQARPNDSYSSINYYYVPLYRAP